MILSNRVLDRETSRVHALWNAQLQGNILDQTKGLSRWDSDTNRAPLCKEPQGECLKDAAIRGRDGDGDGDGGGVASHVEAAEIRLLPLRLGCRDDRRS